MLLTTDYIVEGELQRIVSGNIKRLKDIKATEASDISANLPTRGQRLEQTLGPDEVASNSRWYSKRVPSKT